jgi:hypothetical protein
MTYHDGAVKKRAYDPVTTFGSTSGKDEFFTGTTGLLVPITVCEFTQGAAASTSTPLGMLRQLRYGPRCVNKVAIYDGASALQCYGVSSGYNVNRFALYFDTQA